MTTPRGFVCSDLHVFSAVSEWEKYSPSIEAALGEARILVLNGDTFDFKRSRYQSREETISHGIAWLDGLLTRHPNVKLEYILGNHDAGPDMKSALVDLAARRENLRITETVLILGTNLFLHGDVCDCGPTDAELCELRDRYGAATRSAASIAFAEIVTRARLNYVEHLRRRPSSLVPKIESYLDATVPSYRETTRSIYFGHTHVPFSGYVERW